MGKYTRIGRRVFDGDGKYEPEDYVWLSVPHGTLFLMQDPADPVRLLLSGLGMPTTVGQPFAKGSRLAWHIKYQQAEALKTLLGRKQYGQITALISRTFPEPQKERAISWETALKNAEELGMEFSTWDPEAFSQSSEAAYGVQDRLKEWARLSTRREKGQTDEEYEEAVDWSFQELWDAMYEQVGTELSEEARADIEQEVSKVIGQPKTPESIKEAESLARELEELPECDEFIERLWEYIGGE